MYVQMITVKVPLNTIHTFRRLIETEFLRLARQQPGYVRHYLLEQVDDADRAQLVTVWENQTALEAFRKTGGIDMAQRTMYEALPGIIWQSQGYVVRSQPDD
jgi:heme-degrading monooxygenase HmoA